MKRVSYVPDLARFAAVCEGNYSRLQRLLRLGEGCSREICFDLHDGHQHRGSVRLSQLDHARFTDTWYLEQVANSGRFLNNPRMTVRAYHDVAMAEVLSCYRNGGIRAVNSYPNYRMHLPDEKLQVNVFLADWLDFCLRFGQASDLPAAWSLES